MPSPSVSRLHAEVFVAGSASNMPAVYTQLQRQHAGVGAGHLQPLLEPVRQTVAVAVELERVGHAAERAHDLGFVVDAVAVAVALERVRLAGVDLAVVVLVFRAVGEPVAVGVGDRGVGLAARLGVGHEARAAVRADRRGAAHLDAVGNSVAVAVRVARVGVRVARVGDLVLLGVRDAVAVGVARGVFGSVGLQPVTIVLPPPLPPEPPAPP